MTDTQELPELLEGTEGHETINDVIERLNDSTALELGGAYLNAYDAHGREGKETRDAANDLAEHLTSAGYKDPEEAATDELLESVNNFFGGGAERSQVEDAALNVARAHGWTPPTKGGGA